MVMDGEILEDKVAEETSTEGYTFIFSKWANFLPSNWRVMIKNKGRLRVEHSVKYSTMKIVID